MKQTTLKAKGGISNTTGKHYYGHSGILLVSRTDSILELLQQKTEPTLFYLNPRQGEKINVNPHIMFSKNFIVMTAVVVAANAQGNSTSTLLLAPQVQLQALTPAPSYEDFEILNPLPSTHFYNIIIINGY